MGLLSQCQKNLLKLKLSKIDKINISHNKKILFFLAEGISKKWQSIQTKISPRYKTHWEDILKIK
jgi:Domain of unknown function (DUF4113)